MIKEEDIAKIAYARLVRCADDLNDTYDCNEPRMHVALPDTVTINGNLYGFGLVDTNYLDKPLETK